MTETKTDLKEYSWKQMPGGQLRFWGNNAMRDILGLVQQDDDYIWRLAPWDQSWIDVYPKTTEAQSLLLELLRTEPAPLDQCAPAPVEP